ncbi:hypothetical protein Q31b_02260 [Novipirellula aureliae]|uniref:Uncharacterized protein n=1 Tax=Novipirellula aureliae TaxID=2527966 RepID=A0A5C6E980_9BACT|nr:hypothetical protein [Novipirellula aureliae]TWU45055.1 hypothetical protein Q31b_02260 [Novipirellula aureliae]
MLANPPFAGSLDYESCAKDLLQIVKTKKTELLFLTLFLRLLKPASRGCPKGFNERTAQSFCVPKSDIVEQGYDLSINRYKEVVHEEVDHRPPQVILSELEK